MSRFRTFVVLLLLACLPLKVVAAVAMPFCGTATGAAPAQTASPSRGGHEDHGDNGGHGAHGDHGADHGQHAGHGAMDDASLDSAPAAGDDCGQCGLCHLACASAIPMDVSALKIRFAPVLAAAVPATFLSFIPEVLFRPPLHHPMNALA